MSEALAAPLESSAELPAAAPRLGYISLSSEVIELLATHDIAAAQELLGVTGSAEVITLDNYRKPREVKPFGIDGKPIKPNTDMVVYDDFQRIAASRVNETLFNELYEEWMGYLKFRANSFFLAGGSMDDLIQEARLAFFKAVRDYDGSSSFKSFLDLVVTRQLITAIKTATRVKHSLLNDYVSFSQQPAGADNEDLTLDEAFPSAEPLPDAVLISTEGLQRIIEMCKNKLSAYEMDTLRLFLEDYSYEEIAAQIGGNHKSVDNAIQRVKRKLFELRSQEDYQSPLLSTANHKN